MPDANASPPKASPSDKDSELRRVCFWIAAFAGVAALGSLLFAPMHLIIGPATLFVGGTAALLFVRILFSRTYRQGVDAVNREMQGDAAQWLAKPKKFGDPVWGLFGSRAGEPALLWLRAILVLGILPTVLMQHWIGWDVVMLWFWGAFVAMELSIMHSALTVPPPE
jgi:hypothetical protein